MDKRTKHILKGYLLAASALKDAMDSALTSTNTHVFKYVGYKNYLIKYQQIAKEVSRIIQIIAPIGFWDIDKVRDSYNTPGVTQKEYFEAVYTNLLILISFLEHSIGMKSDEITSLIDFFQANLRKAVFKTPNNENEIQDIIEQLLIGRGLIKGVDYDREKGRVKISIKEVVPDFIINTMSLAIEVKYSKTTTKSKVIVDEINADIQAYGKKYDKILFIVYDVGSIQNEAEFKLGLETEDGNIQVIIIKH